MIRLGYIGYAFKVISDIFNMCGARYDFIREYVICDVSKIYFYT